MAILKSGIDYFPLSINFFDSDKTQLISAHYGLKGESIMLRLLCKVYADGYFYTFGKDELILFTKRMGDNCKGSFVSDVLNELLYRGFFDKNLYDRYKILTSEDIQRIYFEATSRRKCVQIRKEFLLVDVSHLDHVHILGENACKISSNADILKQSKVKESKLKKSTHETSDSPIKDLDYEKFLSWMQENAPYCGNEENFPHQITQEEFYKLKSKYTGKEIAFIIEQIENRKDLRKRYSNLYRTVLNWAKREYEN
ncbi:DUF4373 domain-containing protein [Bacteroides sp. 51]|uniref:DUF4373 domain-containing protein n=1 Tax=Bacteroides sp. 51 TaxID=2302938 RepID=UPI0013D111F4|nr:DUF4373 domain-containing protein [Bacteroides sp. 51]NDV84883.1 DUF4373 domain-containing protein [Bacteroides sp. 51]